jgi:hypothetical protein
MPADFSLCTNFQAVFFKANAGDSESNAQTKTSNLAGVEPKNFRLLDKTASFLPISLKEFYHQGLRHNQNYFAWLFFVSNALNLLGKGGCLIFKSARQLNRKRDYSQRLNCLNRNHTMQVCIHWRTSPVSRSGQRQGHAPQRQMRGKSLLCTTLPLPSKQRPPLTIYQSVKLFRHCIVAIEREKQDMAAGGLPCLSAGNQIRTLTYRSLEPAAKATRIR